MEKSRFYALWLCLAMIIIFIVQNLVLGFSDYFVLNKSAFYNYEIWRFLSSIFLHGSLVHLLYNLFALALFGLILEKFIGSRKFLAVFFLSGIIANIIAVNFYDSSLGASGAIYGILGCLIIIKPMMMIFAYGFPMPMFIAGIVWIIAGFFGIFMPSNIGHIAHLSGMFIGILFGLYFRIFRKKQKIFKNQKMHIPKDYIESWEREYLR